MKDNFLNKIVKKDYNNNLEKVLSKKDFSEEVKNTLLTMFYKIENGYKDYSTIKQDTFDKDEYIEKLTKIIENDCEKIEFITKGDEKQEIVNGKQKEIKCLPIENKILYAIAKIQKRTIVVKYIDSDLEEAFSFLLNTGNNINIVEPLRDFNGFSWNIIVKDIENVSYNLIYQNIIFLLGNKFVDKWVNNYEPLVDYFDLFQSKIEQNYGKKAKESIVTKMIKLSVKIRADMDEEFKEKIRTKNKDLEKQNEELSNRENYIVQMAENKKEKEKEIKEIDKIINDKNLLIEEYEKRNENLPLDKKIFSIRVLKNNLKKDREKLLNEIEECNKVMTPQIFLDKKQTIEEKIKYFDVLEKYDERENLIELQKEIIKCMNSDIKKDIDKNGLINIIYNYRYYSLLPLDKKKCIYEEKELKKILDNLTKNIIKKAINMKVIIQISEKEDINLNITKQLLLSKIISLEDINLKLIEQGERLQLIVFDEEIEDFRIDLKDINKEDLKIKINKKTKLFI